MKQYISGILIAIGIFIIKSTNVDASHGLQVSMRYSSLLDTPTNLVHYTDTSVNIATWYDMYLENTAMCDTAFVLRNLIYSSTPSLVGYVKFSDTPNWIATKYDLYNESKAMKDSNAILRSLIYASIPNITPYLKWTDTTTYIATKYNVSVENKAMRDTAFVLRNLIAASVPVLNSYLQWSDTNTRIATKYGVEQTAQAGRDTASALRTFVYSSLLAYPKWSDTSTRLSSIKRLMDTAAAIRASLIKYDTSNRIVYYNSSGRINNTIKKWVGIVTPSTATDQSINISSAGFSTVLHCKIDGFYNGNLIWVQPKTVSATSVTLDLYRPNTSLVTVLGLSVLGGVPFLTGNDLSNIRLHVEVTGY